MLYYKKTERGDRKIRCVFLMFFGDPAELPKRQKAMAFGGNGENMLKARQGDIIRLWSCIQDIGCCCCCVEIIMREGDSQCFQKKRRDGKRNKRPKERKMRVKAYYSQTVIQDGERMYIVQCGYEFFLMLDFLNWYNEKYRIVLKYSPNSFLKIFKVLFKIWSKMMNYS